MRKHQYAGLTFVYMAGFIAGLIIAGKLPSWLTVVNLFMGFAGGWITQRGFN